jgi:hypothetical protein
VFEGENLDKSSMKVSSSFNIIHPSIVDLYINALTLHVLQEQLNKLGSTEFTHDVQIEVDKATSEYVISVKKAEEVFKNSDVIQNQLDTFTTQRQGTT